MRGRAISGCLHGCARVRRSCAGCASAPRAVRPRGGRQDARHLRQPCGQAARSRPAAYDVLTPTMKAGMSRQQWSSGDIPVYPYPAAGQRFHGWTIQYRTRDELALELILSPTAKYQGKLGQILFHVYLHPAKGRWLVDSFMPGATFAPIGKPGVVQAARDFQANPSARHLQPRQQGQADEPAAHQRQVRDRPVRGHPARPARARGTGHRREHPLPPSRRRARAVHGKPPAYMPVWIWNSDASPIVSRRSSSRR